MATDQNKGFAAFIAKIFFYVVSLIYSVFEKLHSLLFRLRILRTYKPCCKVISVGNITWGGAGKTPAVEAIAEILKKQGRKVAIVTRGYGRKKRYQMPDASYQNMGDEPYMLSKNLPDTPVIIDEDRLRGANLAIKKFGVDVVLLDDGFQHRRIFRDMDIVAIDATNAFGNMHLIPRGILREPISSLRRADTFLITKIDISNQAISGLKEKLLSANPKAMVVESVYDITGLHNLDDDSPVDMRDISKKRVGIVSAIANPCAFKQMLKKNAFDIGFYIEFDDHHEFDINDLNLIKDKCLQNSVDSVLVTQKDAVKLEPLVKGLQNLKKYFSFFVVKIRLELTEGKEKFIGRLHALYSD